MAERYLIDTSGIIKYLNQAFPVDGLLFMDKLLDRESLISFITEIELQVWDPPDEDDLAVYRSFINQSTVIGITDHIIQETIRIRKMYKLKLPDALIAATSLTGNLTLVGDNDRDFNRVPELKYINPKRKK